MKKLMLTTAGLASVALASAAMADATVPFEIAGPGGNQVDINMDMSGVLGGASITVDFTNSGGFTWAGDLLIGVIAPNGNTVEYGGYNLSFGYSSAGDFPSSWDSSSSGSYSHEFDLGGFGLEGGGQWTIQFADGYSTGSSSDFWSGTLTLAGMGGGGAPYGGCCIGIECSLTSQADCEAGGGTYLGDNTNCDGYPCGGEPSGACCLGNDCTVLLISECEGLGGGYLGDNSTCDGDPCDASAGDNCGAALQANPGANAFDTSDATDSGYGDPDESQCLDTFLDWEGSPDRWFSWTATVDGMLTADTCDANSYDTSLVIYQGADCGSLVQIACNGDSTEPQGCQAYVSYITDIFVTEGETYWFRIGGWQGATGPGTLNIAVDTGGDPMGACCVGFDCSSQTANDCAGLGGTYYGDGTNCGGTDCGGGGDTGACCIDDSCTTLSSDDCNDFGGTYYGDGSSCNDVDCGSTDPEGACCIGDDCSVLTAADCMNFGGTYQGDGSNCGDADCGGGNEGFPMVTKTVGGNLVSDGDGYTTDLFVVVGQGGRLDAVAGTGELTKMLSTSGDFYQNGYGGPTSADVNPAFYPIEPDLEWDSRVTIGAIDSTGNPYPENVLQNIGINWDEFEAGGDMVADNGTWFVLPVDAQGEAEMIVADDCSMAYAVRIARLTTSGMDDVITFEGLVQGRFGNGLLFSEGAYIEAAYAPQEDCNENGVNDTCDIADGSSADDNGNGIPDECENNCPADADGDGDSDVDDLLAVIAAFGSGAGPADLDGNGIVNVDDLLLCISYFNAC